MKTKIIILNYMKYVKKNGNEEKPMTKIQFAFADLQNTEKYKGVTVIDSYYKGHAVYDKLNPNLLLKPIDAEFDILTDYYNPLNERKLLKSINDISLF